MSDFWFASVKEEGTYGEPQKWEGVTEINPVTDSEDTETSIENPLKLVSGEASITFDKIPLWMVFLIDHIRRSVLKSCSTCKNCVEMYRYPGFVDAEPCECAKGLECDTWYDKVRGCPEWVYRDFFEKQQRNPDLDTCTYVIRGKEGE